MRIFTALDNDCATRFRRLYTGNDFDQRRFARAILTDKAMHLARLKGQIDIGKRNHAAEAL